MALGSVVGAALGAAVFAAAGYALGMRGGALAGAAIGGALLVAVFVMIWVAFGLMGGSDAFRQTFVPHDANEVAVVAVLADDPGQLAALHGRGGEPGVAVVELDARGRVLGRPARGSRFGSSRRRVPATRQSTEERK